MSDYLKRLKHLSKQLAEPGVAPNVHTNVSFIKLLDHAERLENEREQRRTVDQDNIIRALNDYYESVHGGDRSFSLNGAVKVINEYFEANTWTTY